MPLSIDLLYKVMFILPSLFEAELQKSMPREGFCSVKSLRVSSFKGESNSNEIKSSYLIQTEVTWNLGDKIKLF